MIIDQKGGTFEIRAKLGKSLDYAKAVAIIAERQKPAWVEITVLGTPTVVDGKPAFKAAGTGETFLVTDDPQRKKDGKPSLFESFQAAVRAREPVVSVTGRVHLPKVEPGKTPPLPLLQLTGLEKGKKEKAQ